MSQAYLNQKAAATAAATNSLDRAMNKLFEVDARLQAVHEEHRVGFLTLTELLGEEGLIVPPKTLKSGPWGLAVHLYGNEVELLSNQMEDLLAEVERADLAVRAAEAVLRQV